MNKNSYSTVDFNSGQSSMILGREKDMKKNNAGGYVFNIDDWQRLDRFLILGSDSNTYYQSAKELTIDNAYNIRNLINTDGIRVVNRTVEISDSGRAPKNAPAVFVMAMCASFGDKNVKDYTYSKLKKVCRIGTDFFAFVDYADNLRGWGRGLRKGIASWYKTNIYDYKEDLNNFNNFIYQAIKYKNRNGWTHRDVLRKIHIKTDNPAWNLLFSWITKPDMVKCDDVLEDIENWMCNDIHPDYMLGLIKYKLAMNISNYTENEIINLIRKYNFPWEVLPTNITNNLNVNATLLESGMPLNAMIRQLGKLTSIGLLKPMNEYTKIVNDRLNNDEYIRKSRLHPLNILTAINTYANGHGMLGKLNWEPVKSISDSLENAFYKAFGNVIPTNKNTLIGLDVSGSMCWEKTAINLTASCVGAAMCMVTARTEPNYDIMAFSHNFVNLNITPKMSLNDILSKTNEIPFGGTDCSLPIKYAMNNNLNIETFIVYTDNETWCDRIHVSVLFNKYNKKRINDGLSPARCIVCGLTATNFSIADPQNPYMLDVVGCDSAIPNIINEFSCGNF